MPEIPSSKTSVSTKLERIAELARKMPGAELRTLAHHIDIEWLREAYRRTRKDGAVGVDRGVRCQLHSQHIGITVRIDRDVRLTGRIGYRRLSACGSRERIRRAGAT